MAYIVAPTVLRMTMATDAGDRLVIVIVGGLSGAGKSQLCEWAAADLRMLHMEIDLPGVDGIDHHKLRSEWNAFYRRNNGAALARTLRKRALVAGRGGVLMSLPSNAVLSASHIAAARIAGMKVVIVSGPPELCLEAFLTREQETGRGFDERRWHRFNDHVVSTYADSLYSAVLLATFHADGTRLSRADIVARLDRQMAL